MQHNLRSKITGRFISTPPKAKSIQIVSGRLYGFKGAVVRATGATLTRVNEPQKRYVTFHKTLAGFVPENELQVVSREEVQKYLTHA